jgi:hypothetical protein
MQRLECQLMLPMDKECKVWHAQMLSQFHREMSTLFASCLQWYNEINQVGGATQLQCPLFSF